MPRQTFKLLVFLMVLAVAPAAAGQRLTAARHGSGCPHEAARAAAVGKARGVSARNIAQHGGGGTKITMFERLPSDGAPFGIGRESGVFMP
jgi:hypothetical protein